MLEMLTMMVSSKQHIHVSFQPPDLKGLNTDFRVLEYSESICLFVTDVELPGPGAKIPVEVLSFLRVP